LTETFIGRNCLTPGIIALIIAAIFNRPAFSGCITSSQSCRQVQYAAIDRRLHGYPRVRRQSICRAHECRDKNQLPAKSHADCPVKPGGQSPAHTLKLIEAVGSDAFRLVSDTGNPVFSDLPIGAPPSAKQNAWDLYTQVKPSIAYLHIKDGRHIADGDGLFPDVR
jgi:hypothetical protein